MKNRLLPLTLAVVLLSVVGCASTPDEEEKYRPDPDAEKALQERMTKMRRQNQGF